MVERFTLTLRKLLTGRNQLDSGDNEVHLEYHGGEPMLAPMKDLSGVL